MSIADEAFELKRTIAMQRYKVIYPYTVLTKGFSGFKVDLAANVPTLLIRVDRPKAFLIRTIAVGSIIFVGQNGSVSADSGFPIIASDESLALGIAENTELWGFSTVNATMFILDMGL